MDVTHPVKTVVKIGQCPPDDYLQNDYSTAGMHNVTKTLAPSNRILLGHQTKRPYLLMK